MFIELLTTKNERVSVNINKVLFFGETKKGTIVVLDDGTPIEVVADYEEVLSRFDFLQSELTN